MLLPSLSTGSIFPLIEMWRGATVWGSHSGKVRYGQSCLGQSAGMHLMRGQAARRCFVDVSCPREMAPERDGAPGTRAILRFPQAASWAHRHPTSSGRPRAPAGQLTGHCHASAAKLGRSTSTQVHLALYPEQLPTPMETLCCLPHPGLAALCCHSRGHQHLERFPTSSSPVTKTEQIVWSLPAPRVP